MTFGQFVRNISQRINMVAEKATFMFVGNGLPPIGILMSQLYDDKKDEDGFLYIVYAGENTFGCQNMHCIAPPTACYQTVHVLHGYNDEDCSRFNNK
ncbi:autophagy-related protein [Musa troglodytarum]|nr:autophagy-related protein [Musa troglodytarum]URD78977.1 autophagy-related protein [Musa troglodytarum]